jgi:tetratricopeptide (TPR) repeat protein
MGCDVRVQLAGYRSTSLYLRTEPLPGPNEIGTIVVYPIERVQGSSISYTSLMAPKSAKKSVNQAQKAVRKKNLPVAETLLKAAVGEYPKYAEAWFTLGQVYEDLNRKQDAQESYRKSIVADKAYVNPYMRLAYMALKEQQWKESSNLSRSVLALDPVTLPEAYYINALANLNLSELDLAEESARHGQRLDMTNQFPQFHLILANVFAHRDDTANSIRELKTYLRMAPNSSNAGLVRSRLQELEAQAKEQQAKSGG